MKVFSFFKVRRVKRFALAFAACASSSQIFANTTIHGYLRSGIGSSVESDDQACFQAPGAPFKFRLGNECETYAELSFSEDFAKEASKSLFDGTITLSLVSSAERDWESTSSQEANVKTGGQDFTLALRESYVQTKPNTVYFGRPWAGKRYYRRHNVNMLDFYYLNNSGPGAGVEDISAGPVGKLHFAITRNIASAAGTDGSAQTNLDLRLSDIKIGSGTLEPSVIYGYRGKNGASSGAERWAPLAGTMVSVIYSSQPAVGVQNNLVAQYGTGIFGAYAKEGVRGSLLGEFGGNGSNLIAREDLVLRSNVKKSSTLRLIDHGTFKLMPQLENEFVLFYQSSDFGGAKFNSASKGEISSPDLVTYAAGIRPVYSFAPHYSLAAEYGLVMVQDAFANSDGEFKDATLSKITVAPQISAGSEYFARPQIRLFATYASWNKDTKGAVGQVPYADNTEGWTLGSQVEAWW